MRVESIRALPEFAPVRPSVPADSRVAVLLNANAKRVNGRVERALRHVVPASDFFISHSIEEARSIARWVVDQRYRTVFSGGGDGTFVGWLNLILEHLDQAAPRKSGAVSLAQARCPRFGVLRLGTGNALAELVGASSLRKDGILDDVLRARAGEVAQTRTLDLVSVDGKLAPFAGLGLDGAVLNNYVEVKRTLGRTLGSGGLGYFFAVAGRAVPQHLLRKPAEAEVISNGRVYAVGPDGKSVGEPIGPGEVIYRGPARIIAGGTIPFYGFRFKLFPFAGKRRSMMHLRIADLSVPAILGNLGKIWQGKIAHPGVKDFYADDVTIRFDREMPLQVGGDAGGYRREVRFSMASRSVEVIDFGSNS